MLASNASCISSDQVVTKTTYAFLTMVTLMLPLSEFVHKIILFMNHEQYFCER